MSAAVTAAQDLAQLGWPVMPIKPRSKEPLTRHGVKDATTTERTILQWFDRWPDANLAIATGLPGPNVLDIDNPEAAGRSILAKLKRPRPPEVATPRGPHLYYQGTNTGTVSLGYGELRARGSYVLVPPSIHPSGKQYVWLNSPDGPLPPVPDLLTAIAHQTAGTGDFAATELIPHGQRHDALKDAAVRFLRGGFTDPGVVEQMLQAFFHARCDPRPPPRKDEFRKIAVWAASTDIAARERQAADLEPLLPAKGKKAKKSKLSKPPSGDAPLAEHRAYVRLAGGWPDRVDIKDVRRFGNQGTDRLVIELNNGQRIVFARQEQITTRGHWAKTVILATNGIADPPASTDWELARVLRSLCILADAPPEERDAEDLQNVLDDFLALTEAIDDHDLSTSEGRFNATMHCRARGVWDPRNRDNEKSPAVIVSRHDRRSYIRASELQNYLNWRGLGIAASLMQGRMAMIGAEWIAINGREESRPDTKSRRRTARMVLYRLAPETENE